MLTRSERDEALAGLPGWRYEAERKGIAKSFSFRDFGAAFAFMTRGAMEAEKADHHPDWTNVWNRVDILLTTHRAKGLTAKDVALAREIEALTG